MKPTRITRLRRREKTRLSKERFFFLLALVFCILLLFVGMRFLGSFQALQNKADWAKKLRQAPQTTGTNYLLYGLMRSGEEATIKDIFFLNLPEQGASFHTVFIPGQVLLHRLESKTERGQTWSEENDEEAEVRPYYTPDHFYGEGGAELLVQQLSLFLDAPIHHYMEFDYSGIPVLVDAYGVIAPGDDLIRGREYLVSLMQEENEEEPLERALHRFSFCGDLLKFFTEKKGKLELYRITGSVAPYLKTDFAWKELQGFQEDLESFFRAEDLVVSLPGVWREFDGEFFLEPDQLQLATLSGSLGGTSILSREMITEEILNGSGAAGVATAAGKILEEQGFCIVKIDNADNFEYRHSQVISRLELVEPAKEVAFYIPGAEFFKELQPNHDAMVTVIIGKNFSP